MGTVLKVKQMERGVNLNLSILFRLAKRAFFRYSENFYRPIFLAIEI